MILLFVFIAIIHSVSGNPSVEGYWSIENNVLTVLTDVYDYNHVNPWLSYRDQITEIVITDNVRKIGNYAFAYLNKLRNIIIPASVTQIGENVFANCFNLESVDMSLTEITSVSHGLFYSCTSLKKVILPDTVTTIGSNSFYNCHSLEYVDSLENIISFGSHSFFNCEKLSQFAFTSTVRYIGSSAFSGCKLFTELLLPVNIKVIGSGAFQRLPLINKIEIDATNPFYSSDIIKDSNNMETLIIQGSGDMIDNAHEAYYPWYSLKDQVKVIEFGTGIKSIGSYAFSGFTKITSILLYRLVTVIHKEAFHGCSSLTDVMIYGQLSSIEENAFSECNNLNTFMYRGTEDSTCDSSIFSNDQLTVNVLTYYKNKTYCGNPVQMTTGDDFYFILDDSTNELLIDGSGEIGSDFEFDSEMKQQTTKIVVGDSILKMPSYLLDNFVSLQEVYFGSNMKDIHLLTFTSCNSISSFVVSENNENYASKDDCLYSKDMKTLYRYPVMKTDESFESTKELENIGAECFKNNKFLQKVTLNGDISTIGINSFLNCNNLTQVVYTGNKIPTCDMTVFVNSEVQTVSASKSYTAEEFCGIPVGEKVVEGNSTELIIVIVAVVVFVALFAILMIIVVVCVLKKKK